MNNYASTYRSTIYTTVQKKATTATAAARRYCGYLLYVVCAYYLLCTGVKWYWQKKQRLEQRPSLLPLIVSEELTVNEREDDVRREEQGQLSVDELVEGALPLEEQAGEATSSGTSHITLVGNGHLCIG